jgi:twitching motility protein PilT
MAQLDRLLSALISNRGEDILLTENECAMLRKDGASHPLTRQALATPQLVALVREIAPPDVARQLEAGQTAEFTYRTPDGVFHARASRESGRFTAVLKVDGASNGAASAGTATPAQSRGATASGAVPSAQRTTDTRVVGDGDDPLARTAMETLLRAMVDRGASDLHLRCGEPPILRLHGEMVRMEEQAPVDNAMLERMLVAIMPPRNREEYEATSDTDYAYELPGLARFRCNSLRERKGAGACFRVIPARVVSAEELGISQEVQNLCKLTKGLVLVTGPTGSGKSTTLCGLIDLVNRTRTDHVITIEDPIEFVHQNKKCVITQRQVGLHTGSFKHALRAALREDPDIVLVGELRDLETASIAIETAETGHLVFATLHTTTAAGTIDRLIDQFPADRQEQIRTMMAESLKAVISQVLCRKIGGGRVAAREILLSTPAISNLIREAKTFQITSVIQTSRKSGMITLNDALIELVDNRQVEPKEAYMRAADKSSFAAQLRARGHDASFIDADGVTAPTPQRASETGFGSKTPPPRAGSTSGKR